MSLDDFKGAAHAFRTFMQAAQQDIDTGARKGAERRFEKADGRQRVMWPQRLRLLQAARRRRPA